MTTQQDSVDVERLREEQFVIRRNGAFFRPNAAGYTNHVIAAGFYTADEAARYSDVEGVTIEPLSRYREEAERTIANAQRVLAALSLPITQRDEQAKTYADGIEDAARYVEGHGGVIPGATVFTPVVTGDRMPCMSGDGRDRLMPARRREFDDATRTLATAIRRLSIEQGNQDGGGK